MRKVYEEFKLHICVISRLLGLITACALLVSCGKESITYPDATNEVTTDEGFVLTYAGAYDSIDGHAVVTSIDNKAGTITFYNLVVRRKYTLSFDGTSKFYDKYGSSLVPEQINPGDVVDITFVKNKKLLNSLQKSGDIWIYTDVEDYSIDTLAGNLKMMDGDYRFKEDVLVFAEGKEAELMDINEVDSLTVAGYDHNIYTIVIDGSHGYLRLKGQDYFVGGWIEVGTRIIKNVSDDMLLTVPVGTYDVTLSNGNLKETRTITIEKSKEAILDVSDLIKPDDTKYGDIIFVTNPENADVFVDGQEADISKPVEVEYGIHQLIVRAEGYDTITQYIKVGQEHATLEISLDKSASSSSNAPKASPAAEPQVTTYVTPAAMTTDTASYRVKIEAPEGAEAYLDGSYIGIVPVDFAKNPGTHVITLRKDKYETRSYTITLDSLLQNESFSFALLKKIEEDNTEEENTDTE